MSTPPARSCCRSVGCNSGSLPFEPGSCLYLPADFAFFDRSCFPLRFNRTELFYPAKYLCGVDSPPFLFYEQAKSFRCIVFHLMPWFRLHSRLPFLQSNQHSLPLLRCHPRLDFFIFRGCVSCFPLSCLFSAYSPFCCPVYCPGFF